MDCKKTKKQNKFSFLNVKLTSSSPCSHHCITSPIVCSWAPLVNAVGTALTVCSNSLTDLLPSPLFSRIQTTSSALKGAIQLGIGYTVGNLTSKPDRDVLMQDFYVVESVFLPRSVPRAANPLTCSLIQKSLSTWRRARLLHKSAFVSLNQDSCLMKTDYVEVETGCFSPPCNRFLLNRLNGKTVCLHPNIMHHFHYVWLMWLHTSRLVTCKCKKKAVSLTLLQYASTLIHFK